LLQQVFKVKLVLLEIQVLKDVQELKGKLVSKELRVLLDLMVLKGKQGLKVALE
jgi:hypothetical protein